MKKDNYDILGIAKNAAAKDIKRSYRELAVKYHPDHNPGDTAAEEKFKEISEAYSVLGDDSRRRDYDLGGHSSPQGRDPFAGFASHFGSGVFEEFFNQQTRRDNLERGSDIGIDIECSFLESALGVKVPFSINRRVKCSGCQGKRGTDFTTCDHCSGTGHVLYRQGFLTVQTSCSSCFGSGQKIKRVCKACNGNGTDFKEFEVDLDIPPGAEHGAQFKVRKMGNYGPGGTGHLYVNVLVRPDSYYSRDGNDVMSKLGLTVPEAVLGCTKTVDTIQGKKNVRVPPGVQPGSILRLAATGIENTDTGQVGDHRLNLEVVVPKSLTPKQQELFQELKALEGE
jgi:molecular chaperone DnaJ